MGMKKISVRCCVDLGFNDLSGIFLTGGNKLGITNGNRKRTYPTDVTRDTDLSPLSPSFCPKRNIKTI